MSFPNVLIFGQPFNNYSGGGITLTNLFKGWPNDKIAVAYIGHGLANVTTDVCDTYYQLGRDERKWLFPFNLIQRDFPSGLKTINPHKAAPVNSIQKGLRYKLVNHFFYPFLEWIGIFHFASGISLSERLKDWLNEYKPEVLYLQVSNREEIFFAEELIDYLKLPVVIHMMDDWPSTISNKGLFRNFWKRKIDREFKQLLGRINVHLSISDAMSDEYRKRYKIKFKAFHNPIETKLWLPHTKKNFELHKDFVKILYSGRIGIGIAESLIEVASALEEINREELKIRLFIQTPTKETGILSRLQKFDCVVINPFVSLEQLPEIFSEADILLLANDFNREGIDYLKLSMPTKASEYMVSGTPVLVYSPEETAVSGFFMRNKCGVCVTKHDKKELIVAIKNLAGNEDYRKKVSQNAVEYAKEKFDSLKVREEFQNMIISLK